MAIDVSTSASAEERLRDAAWERVKKRFQVDQIVQGVVKEVRPFGVFFDVGAGAPAFLDVLECPDRALEVGESAFLKIVQFADWNKQIRVILTNQPEADSK